MCELCNAGAMNHPASRINTNGAPMGVSRSGSGLEGKQGGKADLRTARINTDSAPRGVSKSKSGLEGKNG